MDEELQGAIEVVTQALAIGIPCVQAIRQLRDACDRVVTADDAETRAIAREWLAEIFQP